ncbi:hypothetical protein BH20VER3_BH20VER3_00490 [soil metagenome]
MRIYLTLARKHDEEYFSVLAGPEIGANEQKDGFKDMMVVDDEHEYAEIQLWNSSGGMIKRKKFDPPPPALDEMTVPTLKTLARREGLSLVGASTKAEMVAAIERGRTVQASKADPGLLENLTNAELEDLAMEEDLDITGASTKADLIEKITAGRTAKVAAGDEGVFPKGQP